MAQRRARRKQISAIQARVAAAGICTDLGTYLAAQKAVLHEGLSQSTDPTFFDSTTAEERAATRDIADRYAKVSPFTATLRAHLDAEAVPRSHTLTPPQDAAPREEP